MSLFVIHLHLKIPMIIALRYKPVWNARFEKKMNDLKKY